MYIVQFPNPMLIEHFLQYAVFSLLLNFRSINLLSDIYDLYHKLSFTMNNCLNHQKYRSVNHAGNLCMKGQVTLTNRKMFAYIFGTINSHCKQEYFYDFTSTTMMKLNIMLDVMCIFHSNILYIN